MMIVDLPTVDSTNLEAKRRIASGAAVDGMVVTAREQTAGRARRGRGWSSPVGNLYWSLIRYPEAAWPPVWGLSMVAGLAVRDLARAALPASVPVGLKWPNDVLVDGAKVAGILLESGAQEDRPWVVVGIGVNLIAAPTEGLLYRATSLSAAGAGAIDRDWAVGTLAERFQVRLEAYLTDGLAGIRLAVLDNLLGIGGPITARVSEDGARDVSGTLHGLDEQCRAVIETASGETVAISAGDLFFGSGATPPADTDR
jgi:BirA family biotin operon repressor/biotin-[acetyl-CoA-carboxylase] ligase